MIADDYLKITEKLPEGLPEHFLSEVHSQWLASNYVSCVRAVLASHAGMQQDMTNTDFVPQVAVNELETEEQRKEASELLSKITAEDAITLQDEVETAKKADLGELELGDLKTVIEKQWLISQYYKIMATVVNFKAPNKRIASTFAANTSKSLDTDDVLAPFASPKKRVRRDVSKLVPVDPTFRTSAECHMLNLGLGDNNKAQLYLTHFDEAPRWVQIKNKKHK